MAITNGIIVNSVAGIEFHGLPVATAAPVASSHGVLTKAADIRGLDALCVDLHEDPEFARDLLEAVTALFIERIKAWHALAGSDAAFPGQGAWGLADDSLSMISPEQYEEFALPCHQKFYSSMTSGPRSIHLCGRAQHLFPVLHAKLGITIFNGRSSPKTLTIMLIIAVIGIPFVLSYTAAIYWVFRGKVKLDHTSY